MHRNSVVYRLKKLSERYGIDLMSYHRRKDLAVLLASCKVLMRFTG